MLAFFIETKPRGQSRPRHGVLHGHPVVYKSKEQKQDERNLHALMSKHKPKSPYKGPLSLCVTAVIEIPKSKPKKWLKECAEGKLFPTSKPDCSNILKNIEDVMQSMRFFLDDKQIVTATCRKRYGDIPGYQIILYDLDQEGEYGENTSNISMPTV